MFPKELYHLYNPLFLGGEGIKVGGRAFFIFICFFGFLCFLFFEVGEKIINPFRALNQVEIESHTVKVILCRHEDKPLDKGLDSKIIYFDVFVEIFSFLCMLGSNF